jgi:AcrR family transcriptional regulator
MARTLKAEVYRVRRDAFIDAGQRLMQTKGYEQMSVQNLLDDLEASKGAFYHYFDSKQALLEAVIERMVDAGLAAVAPVVDDPHLTALEKLQGVFGGIGRWKTDRKALVLSLLQVWLSDDNAIVREKFRRGLAGNMVPVLSKIVEQGMREGVFKVTSPVATAQVMLMVLLGFQEVATDLFIARQANTVSYEEVMRIFASYTEAFERILGAPQGSVDIADESVMRAWFG